MMFKYDEELPVVVFFLLCYAIFCFCAVAYFLTHNGAAVALVEIWPVGCGRGAAGAARSLQRTGHETTGHETRPSCSCVPVPRISGERTANAGIARRGLFAARSRQSSVAMPPPPALAQTRSPSHST